MPTTTKLPRVCQHTSGFTGLTVVDPKPGERPEVLMGTCLGCSETRYFDQDANIYRTPRDAYRRVDAERRRD